MHYATNLTNSCQILKTLFTFFPSPNVMTITCHGQTTIIVVVLLLVLLLFLICIVHLRFECQLTISFIVEHHAKNRFKTTLSFPRITRKKKLHNAVKWVATKWQILPKHFVRQVYLYMIATDIEEMSARLPCVVYAFTKAKYLLHNFIFVQKIFM